MAKPKSVRTRAAGAKQESVQRRPIGLSLILGAAALVGVVIAFSVLLSSGEGSQRPPAPDFTVATDDGEFHLSQQRGKVVVLYFSFPG